MEKLNRSQLLTVHFISVNVWIRWHGSFKLILRNSSLLFSPKPNKYITYDNNIASTNGQSQASQ